MRKTLRNVTTIAFAVMLAGPVVADGALRTVPISPGAFFELEGGAAFRRGDAKTMDGGASWGGGGQMRGLKFHEAELIRAKLGYRWAGVDTFLSYDRISGGVEWQVDFPASSDFGIPFSGHAISQIILFNVGIRHELRSNTIVVASAGIGASFNSIERTVEGEPPYAWPATDRDPSFAARATLGLVHEITDHVALAVMSTFDYYGQFRTADQRMLGPVLEPIVPYEFDAWGGTISAGLRLNL